jgi:hypothetical protein
MNNEDKYWKAENKRLELFKREGITPNYAGEIHWRQYDQLSEDAQNELDRLNEIIDRLFAYRFKP